jgi:protein-L-isoaspartate(D-aspartate) O-methyltransferase
MVIPIGPAGQHVILKVVKQKDADGSIRVVRANVYNKVVPFVPFVAFTKLDGEAVKGSHNGSPLSVTADAPR